MGALDQRPRDCHDTRWPLHTLALGGVHVDYKGSLVGYKEAQASAGNVWQHRRQTDQFWRL